MTLCPKSGFKTVGSHSILSDYLNSTYSMDDLFEDFGYVYDLGMNMPDHKEIQVTYSMFRGRCFTYNYPEKLISLHGLIFHPRANVSLLVYAHEPGEEIWFHYFWFPEVFTTTHFEIDHFFMDYQIRKEVFVKDENCEEGWTMFQYAGRKISNIINV